MESALAVNGPAVFFSIDQAPILLHIYIYNRKGVA